MVHVCTVHCRMGGWIYDDQFKIHKYIWLRRGIMGSWREEMPSLPLGASGSEQSSALDLFSIESYNSFSQLLD
ncbi:hypothetical protein Mapa_008754 [Marchantia paleacea]|nr:hypothetical protein Mapa_008754 [Marchantia paleacea]